MITYFTGTTFNEAIGEVIRATEELTGDVCIADNQDFYKYIKQNIAILEGLDCIILDVSVCTNTDDEILLALEMIRTMYNDIKIIVFAPYRAVGDLFLKKCFEMGIANIINTDDFRKLQEELLYCIKKGMTYRDAVKFKESIPEKVVVKHVKRAINKRMIGVAGVESNIGATHNAVILANYFRSRGYMVAIAEVNNSRAFEAIGEDFDEKIFDEGYFTLNGIDFYPDVDEEKIQQIQAHSYNVIILDFGCYEERNKDAFERCEDRIIITGAKPWEMGGVNRVFALASKDVLAKYTFCFNFTAKKDYEAIREGMGELNSYFLKYTENPFEETDFADADDIFAEILPEKPMEEKKGFVKWLLKVGESKKRG